MGKKGDRHGDEQTPGGGDVKKKRPRSMLDPKTGRVKPEVIKAIKAMQKPPGPKADPNSKTSRRRANAVEGTAPGNKGATGIQIRKKQKTKAEKKEARQKHLRAQGQHLPTVAETRTLVRTLTLRNKILNLREQGATVRQIAERLNSQGEEITQGTVQSHLVAALEDLHKNYTLKTKHLVQLQINKLERVDLAHFRRLCDPNLTPDNVEKLSRAMERVWKRYDALLGLHKPQKVELSARESLAKLLGRSPEEIPDAGTSDA